MVRAAGPPDAETIARYNRAMARETEGKELLSEVARAGVAAALSDPDRARYFIAEVDENPSADPSSPRIVPAGQTMVTVEWSDWRNGFFWWIQSVYVAPEYRCRGVFGALHAHIRDEAVRRGDVCGLRLYAHHENAHALKTYARLGMKTTDYVLLEEDWSK